MNRIAVLLCVAALMSHAAIGASPRSIYEAEPSFELPPRKDSRLNTFFWGDDVESGEGEWTHSDLTATVEPMFHIDSFLTHPSGTYSYWCGTMDPSFAGGSGYGNGWDHRLDLPPLHLGGTPVEEISWGRLKSRFREQADDAPVRLQEDRSLHVLTFAYRHDSEVGYDFTWVQAESAGTWVDLGGYTGSSDGWQDCGDSGFSLAGFGDPVRVRFRFLSDGAWSDEDGLYVSDGGAFHVDNIKVYDFATGDVHFYDDCEDGVGLCTASVPPAAGDWWHIIDRSCPALSDPHSWWCGDDADTGLVPPGLNNELCTPVVNLHVIDCSIAASCTVHFAIHFAVPTVDNDYVAFLGTCDGEDYYNIRTYWGDFHSCDGWGGTAYNIGYDVGQFSPDWYIDTAGFKFIFRTTDNGCGPAAAGDAGVMIDDIWMEGQCYTLK